MKSKKPTIKKTRKQILRSIDYRIKCLKEGIDCLSELDNGEGFLTHFSVCMDMENRRDELQVLKDYICEVDK